MDDKRSIWLSVSTSNTEFISEVKPIRVNFPGYGYWDIDDDDPEASEQGLQTMILPPGTIEKLIGKKLTWEDEPHQIEFVL